MKTENIKASVTAGKTGEPTARRGAQAPATAETKSPLTADAVASLLRSDFAEGGGAEPGEETPREEQPGEGAEDPIVETGEVEPAGHEDPADPADAGSVAGEENESAPDLAALLAERTKDWIENGKGALPPELQEIVEGRIGKLTKQREAAETERDALREENQRLKTAQPAAIAPEHQLWDEKQLDNTERTTRRFLNDAESYLDDTADDGERARVEKFMADNGLTDVKALKRFVRGANETLTVALPRQREHLRNFRAGEAAAEPEAKKYFPWLDDPKSEEYGLAQEVLQQWPDLRTRTPVHRVALGAFVLGLKQFRQMKADEAAKAKGGPARTARPVTKAPPRPPAGSAAAPAGRPGAKPNEEAARERFNKNPNSATVTELLRESLRG